MSIWKRRSLALLMCLFTLVLMQLVTTATEDEHTSPAYTLTGDLPEIKQKGIIRFLVHGEVDHLSRGGDPRVIEQELARDFAKKLGLKPLFVPVAEQDDLISELNKGFGDVIIAAFAITPERSKQIAFSRPIRFVDQVIVVRASDTSIQGIDDLSGQEVTVRPSSSYAEALRGLKEKGIRIKSAPENLDTFDLLQKVGRGEENITVADSDIFAAALSFEPNIRSPFKLIEKQPIA